MKVRVFCRPNAKGDLIQSSFSPIDELPVLIRALDTTDLIEQRRVSHLILAAGASAVPDLAVALRDGPPAVRKSAAYLLGALKEAAASAPLQGALSDEEPKVRQNAAVALGKLGDPADVEALARALERETAVWVRASMFLALGAIGGEAAHAALKRNAPGDDPREQEAHRKALDRSSSVEREVGWNMGGLETLELWVEAPAGLEEVAKEEAQARGLSLEVVSPGLLRCPLGTTPSDLIPTLRCVHGMLIPIGDFPLDALEDRERWAEEIVPRLTESPLIREWKGWLQTDEAQIQYRFSLEGRKIGRETLRQLLSTVRPALRPLGWIDSPSHYDLELVARPDRASVRLFLRPDFHGDIRFDYRVKDVGASIDPVVGACLARLSRTQEREGIVFEPMCGSGTLLIERAMLEENTRLTGLDISPTAVAAARTNVETAGLASRIQIRRGDAKNVDAWPECREVLANLPFGMRTRHEKLDLVELYGSLLTRLADRLQPHGRAVLYTAARGQLNAAISPHRKALKLERQFTVQTGGLWTHIWVLTKRG